MAQITCSISGLSFSCQYLPLPIHTREVSHPIFHIPKHRLLSLMGRWSAREIAPPESYLLYLALFNSTGLIEWRSMVRYHDRMQQIVANNMESLAQLIGKIDSITHPSFTLPHYAVTSDTHTLENSYHWIQNWHQCYNDWLTGIRERATYEDVMRREAALTRLIKSPHRRLENHPKLLADWAEVAGNFPEYKVLVNGKQIPMSEYWKDIIIKAATKRSLMEIPEVDLEDLTDHCIDNVVTDGSLNALMLIRYLKDALQRRKNFSHQQDTFGIGDIDIASQKATSYRLLKPSDNAADANVQNMINNAPSQEPNLRDYPNKFEHLKAMGRWRTAQNYKNLDEDKRGI